MGRGGLGKEILAGERYLHVPKVSTNLKTSRHLIPRNSPNLWSLSALICASLSASASVYGLSWFALSRGLNMRSRKPFRVCLAPSTLIEDIVTGSVELESICRPRIMDQLNWSMGYTADELCGGTVVNTGFQIIHFVFPNQEIPRLLAGYTKKNSPPLLTASALSHTVPAVSHSLPARALPSPSDLPSG